jgi:hypothetical protein
VKAVPPSKVSALVQKYMSALERQGAAYDKYGLGPLYDRLMNARIALDDKTVHPIRGIQELEQATSIYEKAAKESNRRGLTEEVNNLFEQLRDSGADIEEVSRAARERFGRVPSQVRRPRPDLRVVKPQTQTDQIKNMNKTLFDED